LVTELEKKRTDNTMAKRKRTTTSDLNLLQHDQNGNPDPGLGVCAGVRSVDGIPTLYS
jgi:hypothetical protein